MQPQESTNVGEMLKFVPEDIKWLGVLVIVIITGIRRDWTFGWYSRRLEEEIKARDERIIRLEGQLTLALRAATETTGLAKEAVHR